MAALIDITGQMFGCLTVRSIGPSVTSPSGRRRRLWKCDCVCGRVTVADRQSLRSGNTTSCGCKKLELNRAANVTHGLSRTRTFSVWVNMRQRCKNGHSRYHARGIKVCEKWNRFEQFLIDLGPCPSKRHTLDRINNNGDYEPSNCRWTLHKLNCRNKCNNTHLTHDGERLTIADWSDRLGISQKTLRSRIRLGWSVDAALTTPVRSGSRYA